MEKNRFSLCLTLSMTSQSGPSNHGKLTAPTSRISLSRDSVNIDLTISFAFKPPVAGWINRTLRSPNGGLDIPIVLRFVPAPQFASMLSRINNTASKWTLARAEMQQYPFPSKPASGTSLSPRTDPLSRSLIITGIYLCGH